jgi:hypothetical protein
LDKSNSLLESEPIPSVAILDQVIDLKFGAPVDGWLEEALLTLASDIPWRPSKRFHAKLVYLWCFLSSQHSELVDAEN